MICFWIEKIDSDLDLSETFNEVCPILNKPCGQVLGLHVAVLLTLPHVGVYPLAVIPFGADIMS